MKNDSATRPALLKFQIGPVQDFIAQARSTRDLWSGSYLLSFLIAAGIRTLRDRGGELIFPDPEGQPLLEPPESWACNDDQRNLLTPNLPNLFVGQISGDGATELAKRVENSIEAEWARIATDCFDKLIDAAVLEPKQKDDFLAQAAAFLSIAWQVTPMGDEGYPEAYDRNGRHLDAVRQTRNFVADPVCLPGEKDSLSGRDHAFVRGADALESCCVEAYLPFFKHENDFLASVTLIKRVWHLAYLRDRLNLKTGSKQFEIRSTRAIASRSPKLDDEEEKTDTAIGENYLAAIAFDGDSIGDWMSGKHLADRTLLREHHQEFSSALSEFARGSRSYVEERKEASGVPLGFLIYAGGDDVVALVPADAALDVARHLRESFREAAGRIRAKDGATPDASAGIAIGHFKAPLQDLVRAAQTAEKRAKNEVGRPAFSVTLMKRSGEISEWGDRWDDGGLVLHMTIARFMRQKQLSTRFPHRVCQLLSPYLCHASEFSRVGESIDDPETARNLIRHEFDFATRRHCSDTSAAKELMHLVDSYLTGIQRRREFASTSLSRPIRSLPQELFESVIGLCVSVAFANRLGPGEGEDLFVASDSEESAQPQPAAR